MSVFICVQKKGGVITPPINVGTTNYVLPETVVNKRGDTDDPCGMNVIPFI